MATSNLMVMVDRVHLMLIKDEHTTHDNGQGAIEDHRSKAEEGVRPTTYSGSPRQYLDVDDVLARSLPVCQPNTVPPFRKWIFPWRRRKPTALRATGNPEEVAVPDSPKVA